MSKKVLDFLLLVTIENIFKQRNNSSCLIPSAIGNVAIWCFYRKTETRGTRLFYKNSHISKEERKISIFSKEGLVKISSGNIRNSSS